MKYFKLYEQYSQYQGKDLVVVDIQPEYEGGFGFATEDYINFLNENHEMFNSITILYNGESLGMVSEYEYKDWFYMNGLDEDVMDSLEFYDKGYAFFRFCMDSDIEDELTVLLIKYMIANDINETRDIEEETWDELIAHYNEMGVDMSDVRELLEHSGDMINIPDLMDELRGLRSGNILLTGGHTQECLREVVIALNALDMEFDMFDEFTY